MAYTQPKHEHPDVKKIDEDLTYMRKVLSRSRHRDVQKLFDRDDLTDEHLEELIEKLFVGVQSADENLIALAEHTKRNISNESAVKTWQAQFEKFKAYEESVTGNKKPVKRTEPIDAKLPIVKFLKENADWALERINGNDYRYGCNIGISSGTTLDGINISIGVYVIELGESGATKLSRSWPVRTQEDADEVILELNQKITELNAAIEAEQEFVTMQKPLPRKEQK